MKNGIATLILGGVIAISGISVGHAQQGPSCYWMESKAPNLWVPSPSPVKTQAECQRLDSCSPGGGKASGGGCYVWVTADQVKAENAKKTVAPAPQAANGIKLHDATYGLNCKAAKPDVTAHIASQCDGKANCSYKVDHTVIGDPAFGCRKEYVANYECLHNGQSVKKASAKADAEASGKTVALDCAGAVAPSPSPGPAPSSTPPQPPKQTPPPVVTPQPPQPVAKPAPAPAPATSGQNTACAKKLVPCLSEPNQAALVKLWPSKDDGSDTTAADLKDTSLNKALIVATYWGNAALTKAILDAGGDVNFVDTDKSTPLIMATWNAGPQTAPGPGVPEGNGSNYLETVKVLIAKGANTKVMMGKKSVKDLATDAAKSAPPGAKKNIEAIVDLIK